MTSSSPSLCAYPLPGCRPGPGDAASPHVLSASLLLSLLHTAILPPALPCLQPTASPPHSSLAPPRAASFSPPGPSPSIDGNDAPLTTAATARTISLWARKMPPGLQNAERTTKEGGGGSLPSWQGHPTKAGHREGRGLRSAYAAPTVVLDRILMFLPSEASSWRVNMRQVVVLLPRMGWRGL